MGAFKFAGTVTIAMLAYGPSSPCSAQASAPNPRVPPWEAQAQAKKPASVAAPSDPSIVTFTLPSAYEDCATPGSKQEGPRDIAGYEPKAPGRYPVFIYLTGTLMKINGPEAQFLTSQMAKRGFLAAAVDYDNAAYPYCPVMQGKASCIFDAKSEKSAVAKVCALPKADCARGIVVAGFSQGANLAALAANSNPQVRAAYLLGHGDRALNGIDVSRCADDAQTTLTANQMRSVTGDQDLFFGGSTAGVRKQLQKVVGAVCDEALDCAAENGSGWHIVASKDLKDGAADHCYFLDGANVYCSTYSGLDPNWQAGKAPWAAGPNLDWLAAQIPSVQAEANPAPANEPEPPKKARAQARAR